jgi:hypothetical protein
MVIIQIDFQELLTIILSVTKFHHAIQITSYDHYFGYLNTIIGINRILLELLTGNKNLLPALF